MSAAKPLDVPPDPTPEQRAVWRPLLDRVEAGNEAGLRPWDQHTADAAYRVLVPSSVRRQLADAPPTVRGQVDGTVAVLRVEPVAPSAAFQARTAGEVCSTLVAGGYGVLTWQVIVWRRVVVVLNLAWADPADTPSRPGQPPSPQRPSPKASSASAS